MESPFNPVPGQPPLPSKMRNPLVLGCAGLLILLLLVAGSIAATVWWMQRPITPVVLSAEEKAVVESKIQRLGYEPGLAVSGNGLRRPAVPVEKPDQSASPSTAMTGTYVPGSKVLKLSDREVNGLLNQNTELGKMVRIEFAQDAVHAYFAIPIPEDFPVGAGMVVKARGRFKISIGPTGTPYAILDDITVFGISLPKDWLGGIKGENLLGEAMGGNGGSPVFSGIKSLHVEPGALVLEVED